MQEIPRRVLLVEDNPGDAQLVREMLAQVEGQTFVVYEAGCLLAGLDALAQEKFDVALIDLTLPDSEGIATFETIQRHAENLPIVVFTGVANEALALTAVSRGAQEYLVKGRMSSQALGRVLRYSMVRQLNAAHARPEPARAQVAGFLGAKGGTGTTTLAAHFALAWKRQTGGKVLLLDMDSGSTSMDFLIRPNARYSIQDVATNLHRLDSNFWQSVVTETPLGVDFLSSPCGNGFGESLPVERVRHVLRFARREYPSIVVDLARLNPLSIGLIEETATLFVVTTAELPAVSEANRVLKKLLEVGIPQDQLRLVFNRVPKAALNLVAELEKALGYPAYACIGDFSGELTESYGDGQRLEEGLALHKQVSDLVAKARGVPAHARTNVLRRLLSRH